MKGVGRSLRKQLTMNCGFQTGPMVASPQVVSETIHFQLPLDCESTPQKSPREKSMRNQQRTNDLSMLLFLFHPTLHSACPVQQVLMLLFISKITAQPVKREGDTRKKSWSMVVMGCRWVGFLMEIFRSMVLCMMDDNDSATIDLHTHIMQPAMYRTFNSVLSCKFYWRE